MNPVELDLLAKRLAIELLESPAFRLLVKEIVLVCKVELEQLKEGELIRCFFHACDVLNIHLSLGPNGRIRATNAHNLSADMREVIKRYYAEIVERLKNIEESRKARLEYQRNGQAKEAL